MTIVTANELQKNFDAILDSVLMYEETVAVATDKGAVMMIKQEEWEEIQETLYLKSIPGMEESILQATPIEECVDSVEWDINLHSAASADKASLVPTM
ncbi:MAG: type II toxin-antitoxin system Phd/YefM family antitoxin [Defluviitaleaceae bacterium]|nr:type II toxin-antitoxin system Phd/YefM family antitoxin [Defluviitaleaceae bacterium]